jgi:hypothetical protein
VGDFEEGIPFDPWSKEETEEWIGEQNARDKPNVVRLPNAYDIITDRDPLHHQVIHPSEFATVDLEYVRVYPFLWFACDYPNRPTDEAMLMDMRHCDGAGAPAPARVPAAAPHGRAPVPRPLTNLGCLSLSG